MGGERGGFFIRIKGQGSALICLMVAARKRRGKVILKFWETILPLLMTIYNMIPSGPLL